MNINRRHFIKLSTLAAAWVALLKFAKPSAQQSLPGNTLPNDDTSFNLFANPQNFHRPFVRWWWNGDRVTKEEVLRELDVLKDSGIGGVEINPIKWNENADAMGLKELIWGSAEWLDIVETAVKGAKKKGLICDMIVGSGWPYGGEHVPRNEQSQIVILGTKNLEGGKIYTFTKQELLDAVTPPSSYQNRQSELFMLRLAPTVMNEFTTGVDLDNQMENDVIEIKVPKNGKVLYYLVKVTGFQSVIQGALGAKGPVINHYDKAAVENYLNHFSDILTARLGPLGNYFRAFFTDSIELEGANWCNDMFEQFKQRKGYDIKPYLPYILFKVGEMGNAIKENYGAEFSTELRSTLNRVRYDFLETKVDLFQERFIGTFVKWCAKHGVRSRMQAYGMDCNPLEASMLIDIPECETWIGMPVIDEFDASGDSYGGRNYTMINKFVSSAAHLSGKQLISCEEMTNTGQIFSTTLERVKVAGDLSNLSGVTHSILHGYNYSPLEVPFPGWLRYGSYFNERNTWWPYFKLWAEYKARMSSLFQNSVMQADIAILHPLADLVSKYGFQRDPFPNISYPPYVHKVWEVLHQSGNGCDYVSEHILQQATKGNGMLTFNNRSYKTLLLVEVETIYPETAKAIQQFADIGGKVIFVAKIPHQSSGMTDFVQRGREIAGISNAILKQHPKTTGIVNAPSKDMLSWYHTVQQQFSLTPFVKISQPVPHVSQLYCKDGTKDIYYFTNYSAIKPHHFEATFNNTKSAWLWNAETGQRFLYPVETNRALRITLGPSESKIIVFDDQQDGAVYTPIDHSGAKETILPGPWQLELQHINDTSKKISLPRLIDLKQRTDTKDFSGTIIYRTLVNMTNLSGKTYLTLGHIYDVSELEVNGRPIGTKWYGDHLYDISKAIQNGDNYISIKIITTTGAYAKSLKNNKAAQEWSGEDIFGPTGLTGTVKILTTNP